MTINELSFMPGDPKPRSSSKGVLVWSLLGVTLAFMIGVFYFHFKVLPGLINESEESQVAMTEADWEREICANLRRYTNGAEFEEYCAGL